MPRPSATQARKSVFDPPPPDEHKCVLCDESASRRGTSWPTRAVFRERIKTTYVGLVLSERLWRLTRNLSGRDPKKGQPEAVWKNDWGF